MIDTGKSPEPFPAADGMDGTAQAPKRRRMGSASVTPATSPHTSQLGPNTDGISLGAVAGLPMATDGAESKPAGGSVPPGLPGTPGMSPPPAVPIGKGAKVVGKGGNLMLSRNAAANKGKGGGASNRGGGSGRGGGMGLDDTMDSSTILVQGKSGKVRLPLDIGTRVDCKWRDGAYHTVRVIERRNLDDPGDPRAWDYYVHYIGFNRRMDEWVILAQLDLSTAEVEQQLDGPADKKGQKKKVAAEEHDSDSEHADFDPNALREHEEFTKVKNIETIELGRHQMDTWYFSPFPPEFKDCKQLYFCEFSLHFFKRRSQMLRHMRKCGMRHPPGNEIYRNGNICMFEVDGKKEKAFCQNLCYLAKLFLDHKTLYYDVDLFLFYILCELDDRGAHIVGYFSKEKCSEEGYNLACILTLPAYQRKGYGKFLISMSYELSKIECKVGTPERPLSDLGRVSYHGYWTRELLGILRDTEGSISIKELSDLTAIKPDDIINTLQALGLIQYQKGQHVICAARHLIEKHLKAAGGPGLVVDPTKIVWTPYNAERDYANFGR
ncbi:hypothetical protein Vretimale_3121 [Volvox reticuliferus]|uniref:Histone acetyltransferase n=1 Tax=Volvox reticuliferus TaxID=1737510 RepID=A0A8J4CBS5_9CHLO|nr:hypothetical protein Vretifemale_6671 [Volvox reticuliferus]GIL97586.1 hypothetical protein Vretimale_3121 [Volvox reticuliferus]